MNTSKQSGCLRRWQFAALAAFLAATGLPAQTPPPVPGTVTEEVFRSRWTGPQMDRTGGEIAPEAAEEGEGILESLARGLFRPKRIGLIDFKTQLSTGWEYSDQNFAGQTTDSSDDSSFFIAPSIAVAYEREAGPWSLSGGYSAGIRYYLNPNYRAAGTGNQRNPIFQSGSLGIGHVGARHRLQYSANGSYGTGYDVNSGGNLTQFTLNNALDYDYILMQYAMVGAAASYRTTVSTNGDNSPNDESVITSFAGQVYADYLWTGKTRLRLTVGAGQDSQTVDNFQAGDNGQTVDRSYMQTLLAIHYEPTGKFACEAGLGLGYVQDPRVSNPEYTGLRPVYNVAFRYEPTEKTEIRGNFGFQGTDIRPVFRLEMAWQPAVNTGFSLTAYQNQGFSIFVSDQVQVTRGISGAFQQRLFSHINLILNAGWQNTENLSLSGTGEAARQSGTSWDYWFFSLTARWTIRQWLSWDANLWTSTSGSYQNSGTESSPETRFTVSLNLTF